MRESECEVRPKISKESAHAHSRRHISITHILIPLRTLSIFTVA